MKKLTLIVVALFVAMSAAVTFAEEEKGLIPSFPVLGGKLKLQGFVQGVFTEQSSVGQDTDIPNARIRATYDHGDFGGSTVINFADLGKKDGDWLREFWVRYSVTDKLQIRAGRLFIASGNSTPAPFDQELVDGTLADVFDCYAWGGQVVYNSDEWFGAFDITGKPGVSFQSDENWQTLACSGHLERKFESGSLGGTFQITEDFRRFGFGGTWKPNGSLTLRSEACYEQQTSGQLSDQVGMYLFAGYRPIKNWEVLHGQVDFRQKLAKSWTETQVDVDKKTGKVSVNTVEMRSTDEHDATFTVGTRALFGKDDALSLTADCQIPLDDASGVKDTKFLARVQFKF